MTKKPKRGFLGRIRDWITESDFPQRKVCWNCAYYERPRFEVGRCGKKMVWYHGFFNGVKYYEMGALQFKNHGCRKFKKDSRRP